MKKKIISLLLILCMAGSTVSSYGQVNTVKAEAQAEETLDFSGYDVMTLSDINISDMDYTTNKAGSAVAYRKNLDGVLYDFYVKTAGQLDCYLGYPGGSAGWYGIVVQFNNGNIYTKYSGLTQAAGTTGNWQNTFQTDKAKWNEEMRVRLAIDYLAEDTDGKKNDIQLKVWIDESFVGEYTYRNITDATIGYLGASMLFATKANYSLRSISMDERLAYYSTQLTFSDFGIASGTYTAANVGAGANKRYKLRSVNADTVSLDGTVLSTHMQMHGETDIRYGGKDANWGIHLYTWNKNFILNYIHKTTDKRIINFGTTGDGSELIAKGCDLKLFTNVIDADGDGVKDDLKIGIYLSDGEKSFYSAQSTKELDGVCDATNGSFGGTNLSIYEVKDSPTKGSKLVITEQAEEQKTPEELGYKKVTFGDFNVQSGIYETKGSPVYGYYTKGKSLDGTYLDVDVTFAETEKDWGGTAINFAGNNPLGWLGLRLYKTATGFSIISTSNASLSGMYEARYETLAITDSAQPVNIQLGVQVSGEDLIADLWINHVRQPQMFFKGGKANFGNYASVYCDGSPITIGSSMAQTTPEELGFVTIGLDKDFQIPDAEYGCQVSGTPLLVEGKYQAQSLNNTCLNMDVKFSGEYADDFTYIDAEGNEKKAAASEGGFRYAGLIGSWTGIKIQTDSGKLLFTNVMQGMNTASISSEQAGVDFTETFNLKLGTKIYDMDNDGFDDIELYVWINDKYMGVYNFTNMVYKDAKGNTLSAIGNVARIYMNKEGQSVTVATPGKTSKPEEVLNADYTKSTFASFQFADGTYRYKETTLKSGAYPFSMNKTVFTGNISFAEAETAELRIGGKQDAWHGLKFWMNKGSLYMQDATGLTKAYMFLPTVAEVDFTKDVFNLQMSFEYVDCDSDGAVDDVKLGIWFNGKLYNNTYIELVDYKQQLGKCMGIYMPKDSTGAIVISSVEGVYTGVDYSIWGFSRNWEKEIGVK